MPTPAGAHAADGQADYIEGVIRWENRVGAYAFLLITDRYPPFSLQP